MSLGAARLFFSTGHFTPGIPPAIMTLTAPDPSITQAPLLVDTLTAVLSTNDPAITIQIMAWPNGFTAYRDIIVPAAAVTATLTGFVAYIEETRQGLRTLANGGRVHSSDGWDIRFETTAGVKLNHDEPALYDPVTGDLKTWVQIPSLGTAAYTQIRLYYGKAGLVATEASPIALWAAGHKLVLNCRTGADRTGNGFTLTPSGIGGGTLIGDAGDFVGNSVATKSDASALAGLTACTLQAFLKADVIGTDMGAFCVNTPTGASNPAALTFGHLALTSAGVVNTLWAKIKTATGNAYVLSTGDRQTTETMLVHAVFQNGQAPKLYINGNDVSGVTVVQSGALAVATGGIFLGASALDGPTGGWDGLIDELRLVSSARSPAWVAAEGLSYMQPTRFYGIGGENLADNANLSPVAPPLEVAGTVGVQSTIDVAANGYDPGGGALTIVGTPTADDGSISVVSNKIRFTPDSTGLSVLRYVLQEPGGKQASGRVFATAGEPPPTSADEYPAPTGIIYVIANQAAFDNAKAAALPGDHLVLNDGINISIGTWTRPGTAAEPIVIRANANQSPAMSGNAVIAASHVRVWGMRFGAARCTIGNNMAQSGIVIRRCSWSGLAGVAANAGPITMNVTNSGFRFEYCEMTDCQFIRGLWGNLSTNGIIKRCLFKNWTGTTTEQTYEPITVGESNQTHGLNTNWLIEYCLFRNINLNTRENECVSVKSGGNTVQFCLFDNARNMNCRLGTGNRFYACRITGTGATEIHGKNHVYNSVYIENGGFGCIRGNYDANLPGPIPSNLTNQHPQALNTKLIGCRGPISVGTGSFSPAPYRATGLRFEGHLGITEAQINNVQGGAHEWTWTSTLSEAVIVPPTLLESEVGVLAGL